MKKSPEKLYIGQNLQTIFLGSLDREHTFRSLYAKCVGLVTHSPSTNRNTVIIYRLCCDIFVGYTQYVIMYFVAAMTTNLHGYKVRQMQIPFNNINGLKCA